MGIFFKRSSGPMVYGHGLGYIVRFILLLCIFALCGMAFWYNFERRFAKLEAYTTFDDTTGRISKAQKEEMVALMQRFEKDWGVDVLVHVRPDMLLAPTSQEQKLFIGFVPERGQVLLILPPLLKKVIPPETLRFMTTELDTCVREKAPDICITQTITGIDTYLRN